MVVKFTDSNAGTAVYVNPDYVVTVRPDPVEPTRVSVIKLRDGESLRVHGEHQEVADRLAIAA